MSNTKPASETDNLDEEDKFAAKSMFQIIYSQFIEHKFAVIGLFVILLFFAISIFAPAISAFMGIDPETQNVFFRYKPPLTVATLPLDDQELRIEEFIRKNPTEAKKMAQAFEREGIESMGEDTVEDFLLAMNEEAQSEEFIKELKNTKNPSILHFIRLRDDFKVRHILGTDELGRDVLMRLIYGARVSIGVGLMVAITSALIGLIVGLLAGYYGGVVDSILMRITDSLLSLPLLPLLIVFAAVDFRQLPVFNVIMGTQSESIYKLVIVLCLFSWMTVARLVRGSILSVKERDFILAAKTLGAKDSLIMIRHIVPNVIAPLLVAVTLNIGNSILFEAALSFLGLGIQPPTPSWGNMLFNAQELIYEAPLLAIVPGLLILMVVISFNFFGDGLQDAMDPKSIRR